MRRLLFLIVLLTRPAMAQTPAEAGARADGTGSDTAAFQRAQDTHTGQAATVRVGPGLYALGSNVYTTGPVAWLFERGARLTGPGQIDAVADEAVLNESGWTLARLFAAPGNEFGLFVSARAAPSRGHSPYEKAAFISSVIQGDPSDYGRAILRDLVGYESQGVIPPGNLTGRIWGFNSGVGPLAGADGYAVGGEFGVQSYSGRDAGPLGTPTSKIGVHAVAYGDSRSTVAFLISGNGTTWEDGFVAQAGALAPGSHAVSVRPTGTTRTADVAWLGVDGSLGASRQAELHAGALGVSRTRVMAAETAGTGPVELTDDGAAPGPANTIILAAGSAIAVRQATVMLFHPGSGWTATYRAPEVVVSRGPAGVVATPPGPRAMALVQQTGPAPGAVAVSLGAIGDRIALTVSAASPLHAMAQVETMELR